MPKHLVGLIQSWQDKENDAGVAEVVHSAVAQLRWLARQYVPELLGRLGLNVTSANAPGAVMRLVPSALRKHINLSPGWQVLLSSHGDALAILQDQQVSFRYAADNFRITKNVLKGSFLLLHCSYLFGAH